MDNLTRVAIIKKEIATYRMFANVLNDLKAVVQTFDGKCYNKNFEKALDDFLNSGKEIREYLVTSKVESFYSSGDSLELRIHVYDNDVEGKEKDSLGYSRYYRIGNEDCYIRMNFTDISSVTDSGKYRLIAEKITARFDKRITELLEEADKLEVGLNDVENMEADLLQLQNLMKSYKEKYNYRIMEVFGCLYDLNSCNSYEYSR